jgi:tetrapyrrole methylase family protein/MazG family protein
MKTKKPRAKSAVASKKLNYKIKTSKVTFNDLVEVMRLLRSEQGCPWDREQTHESILSQLVEETYEVMETIHAKKYMELRDELGDLLLHVLFHAQLAHEENHFHATDILQTLYAKLIRRHPHVFGESAGKLSNGKQVNQAWSEIKRKEEKKSLLGGVPKAMPALQRAWRLNDKASSVGFDWQRTAEVFAKLTEERAELEEAIASGDQQHILEEYGDLLFCLVNLGRFLKVDPEQALHFTNDKFIRRFEHMESTAAKQGRPLNKMNLEELEALYQQARKDNA